MRRIYLNNVEITADIDIEVNKTISGISSCILKNVRYTQALKDAGVSLLDVARYMYVKIMDDGEPYFSGYARRTSDLPASVNFDTLFDIQVLEKKSFLSKTKPINRLYTYNDGITNGSARLIVEQIFAEVCGDLDMYIGTNELEDTDIINVLDCSNMTAYDAFEKIASIINMVWFTIGDVLFFLKNFSSPDYSLSLTDDRLDRNVRTSFNSLEYFTSVTVESQNILSTVALTDVLPITATTNAGIVSFPIASVSSMTWNGGTVATYSSFDNDDVEIIWKPNSTSINIKSIPAGKTSLTVVYQPYIPRKITLYNESEIAKVAAASGLDNPFLNYYQERNDLTSEEELYNAAVSLLGKKSIPEVSVKLTAYQNIMNLGGRVGLTDFEEPSSALDGTYVVKSVKEITLMGVGTDKIDEAYDYELTNSYYVKSSSNFFDNSVAPTSFKDIDDIRIDVNRDFQADFYVYADFEYVEGVNGDLLGASDTLVDGFGLSIWDEAKVVEL